MIAFAALTFAVLFSVSYAHWQAASGSVTVSGFVGKWEDTPAQEYYLYGTIGGDEKWSIEKGYKLQSIAPDSHDENMLEQYTVELTLHVGDRVKIYSNNAPSGVDGWSYNNFKPNDWAFGKYETYQYGSTDQNFVIKQTGVFTFYLKFFDQYGSDPKDGKAGGHEVFVEYEHIPLMSGDGIYVGTTLKQALVQNTAEGKENEVMALDVSLEVQTAVTLKYGGVTAKPAAKAGADNIATGKINASTGAITLPAGRYSFYYDIVTDELWISGGEYSNFYVRGDMNGWSDNADYRMTKVASPGNSATSQYTITFKATGDFSFKVANGTTWYDKLWYLSKDNTASGGTGSNITTKKGAGTYTINLYDWGNNAEVEVLWSA